MNGVSTAGNQTNDIWYLDGELRVIAQNSCVSNGTVVKAIFSYKKELTLLGVIIITSLIINVALIVSIVRNDRFHCSTYYFLISLSVADIGRTAFTLTFIFATIANCSRWNHSESLCQLTAFVDAFLVFSSYCSVFMISLDRYIRVVHAKFHAKKSNVLSVMIAIVVTWSTSFVVALPPVFRMGTYRFIPLRSQCTFEHRYYKDNDTLGFLFIECGLLLMTALLYYKIFVFLRRHRKLNPIPDIPAHSNEWAFALPARLPGMSTTSCLHGLSLAANPRVDREPAADPSHIRQNRGNQRRSSRAISPYFNGRQKRQISRSIGQISPAIGGGISRSSISTVAKPDCYQYTRHMQTRYNLNRRFGQREKLRSSRQEHVTRIFVLSAIFYSVTWLPYHVVSWWQTFDETNAVPDDLVILSAWMTYMQVAIDPLLLVSLIDNPLRKFVNSNKFKRETKLRKLSVSVI